MRSEGDPEMTVMELELDNGFLKVPTPVGLDIGIAARRANPLDYTGGDDQIRLHEKELIAAHVGTSADRVFTLNQVHGDTIVEIDPSSAGQTPFVAEADGMLTAFPDICLVIRTADCIPVFVYDETRHVLGAVHSGWRGCRLDIAGKMVDLIRMRHGSRPGDLIAFILPGIGPDSYTVNEDVASHFPGHVVRNNGSVRLDLPGSIRASLAGRGLHRERILSARRCTLEEHDIFYSHRAGHRGRNLNFGLMSFADN